MSSSLLLQYYSACFHFSGIVCEIGCKWPYSWALFPEFVQNSLLHFCVVYYSIFSIRFVSANLVHPYSRIDSHSFDQNIAISLIYRSTYDVHTIGFQAFFRMYTFIDSTHMKL